MTLWQAIILGILQGLTEFLPVSSSGHLVIVPYLLGWPNPEITLNAMLHLGTLIAIIIYFWTDLWNLAKAAWKSLLTRSLDDHDARLAWGIALGTLPAAVIGFLFEDFFESLFATPKAAAAFLLGTAALLLISEYLSKRKRSLDDMTWAHAIYIGLAQTLAIAPGLSRSGSTIAAGLLLGYRREAAARYSFLLSVPIVLGSGLYQVLKLMRAGAGQTPIGILICGLIAAGLTGYVAVAGLLALVKRQSLWPFAVYCALLGTLVLTGVLHA